VGSLATLDTAQSYTIETATGRYCVRFWQGEWIAHSAVCPHQLGPLQDSDVDSEGRITCPWHGYKFDLKTGESNDGACAALSAAPDLVVRDGELYLAAT